MDEKKKFIIFILTIIGLLMVSTTYAFGHSPSIVQANTKETALEIEDYHLSRVWYFQEEFEGRALYIKFDVPHDYDEVLISVGIPVIQDQRDTIPRVDVIVDSEVMTLAHLGIAEEECNMVEIHHRAVVEGEFIGFEPTPCRFYEPFSGTESWIVGQELVPLRAGTYYVVLRFEASDNIDQSPYQKAWVAIGEEEEFGAGELLEFQQTVPYLEEFHESTEVSKSLYQVGVFLLLLVIIGFSVTLIRQGKRRK